MNRTTQAFEALLRAYEPYYNVERSPRPPFAAEAAFHSHEEQYFLVRAARLAEAEAHEYVFFAVEDRLSAARLRELDAAAWAEGLRRVRPHGNHRSTDVSLIVLADETAPEALALVPKLRHYRSYRWSFHGWSHFRLCVWDGVHCVCNRQGRSLGKLVRANLEKLDSL